MTNSGPDPIDIHVGAQIRLRRKSLSMSQSTLSKGLGLTFQQVQKYERGANRVSASMLFRIAHLLEAPISYFFHGIVDSTGHPLKTPSDLAAISAAQLVPSVLQIPKLPREQQIAIHTLLKALGSAA